MFRFQYLLQKTTDPKTPGSISLRNLAKATRVPVQSLHNYLVFGYFPRVENLEKMSKYFGESVASLCSQDDDLTASVVERARNLTQAQKKKFPTKAADIIINIVECQDIKALRFNLIDKLKRGCNVHCHKNLLLNSQTATKALNQNHASVHSRGKKIQDDDRFSV